MICELSARRRLHKLEMKERLLVSTLLPVGCNRYDGKC
jgi:hypothetical protein